MAETLNHCDRCGRDYYYPPEVHRCPGEWEAICAAAGVPPLVRYPGSAPDGGETWVEEQMRKQKGRSR